MGSGSAAGKELIKLHKSRILTIITSWWKKTKNILGCMKTLFMAKKVSLLCWSKALMLRSGS